MSARALLVEDDPATARALERSLRLAGFEVEVAASADEAVAAAWSRELDVVLIDAHLPGRSGLEVLDLVRRRQPELQVLLLAAEPSESKAAEALRAGAYDWLVKYEAHVLVEKVRKAAERTALERERLRLVRQVERHDREMVSSLARIAALTEATLLTVVQAHEGREQCRRGHGERVGRLAESVARTLRLGEGEIELIAAAARVADLGFVGLPDVVLLKQGALSDEERALVQRHVTTSTEALATVPRAPILLPLVRHHHERWDGSGYPDGLAGEDIPLGARIIAAADTFDAMVSPRPYRPDLSLDEAVRQVHAVAGSQLDPRVVEALMGAARPLPV